jgi:hypothetical protein
MLTPDNFAMVNSNFVMTMINLMLTKLLYMHKHGFFKCLKKESIFYSSKNFQQRYRSELVRIPPHMFLMYTRSGFLYEYRNLAAGTLPNFTYILMVFHIHIKINYLHRSLIFII